MARGIFLETIGNLIDGRYIVTGHCNSCYHAATLDLDRLADKLGRDWVYIRKRWPIRCSACGSANTTIRIGQPPKEAPKRS